MKILETAALTDEVYFAFIDLAAKYSDRFSFEMNEPISEKAVQTKRNIIMETIADGSVGMEMKERIVAQQLDALVCAPVETLQYYTCCIPYMRLMERHELKGAEPAAGRRFYDVNRHTVALLKVPLSLRAWSGTAYPMNLSGTRGCITSATRTCSFTMSNGCARRRCFRSGARCGSSGCCGKPKSRRRKRAALRVVRFLPFFVRRLRAAFSPNPADGCPETRCGFRRPRPLFGARRRNGSCTAPAKRYDRSACRRTIHIPPR